MVVREVDEYHWPCRVLRLLNIPPFPSQDSKQKQDWNHFLPWNPLTESPLFDHLL